MRDISLRPKHDFFANLRETAVNLQKNQSRKNKIFETQNQISH